MNFSLNSIPLIINQVQDHSAITFSNSLKDLPQTLKIIAIAALVFSLLGLLLYGNYRYYHDVDKEIIQQSEDQSEVIQKVNYHSPLIADLPKEDAKKIETTKVEATKVEAKNEGEKVKDFQPFLPKPFIEVQQVPDAIVPPLPDYDYSKLFDQLASQTSQPSVLPYSQTSCRFTNILCPLDTHVKISGGTQESFLHANHVHLEGLHFIVTQYPLPGFASLLFWRACEQSCLILDLTNENDMQKGLEPYAPSLNERMVWGDGWIQCKKEESLAGINAQLYTYGLHDEGEEFDISRLHYEGWDDFQGITEDDLDRIIAVLDYYQKDSSQPILIHCRAGVGRSGTLSVAFALSHLIRQNKVTVDNLQDHLSRLILEGRRQRGPFFVQTQKQLEALGRWSWRALHRAQGVS